MKKLEKPRKPQKVRRGEQLALRTGCGHCGRTFPNPTLANEHLAEAHS